MPDPAARARHGAAGLHAGPGLHAQVGRAHGERMKTKPEEITPGQKKKRDGKNWKDIENVLI